MNLNYILFYKINQFAGQNKFIDLLFILLAKYMPFIFIFLLALMWFRNNNIYKNIILCAIYSSILGLIFNFIISLLYYHPRPFVIHLGHCLINHSADSSFPSDHATFMLSIALELFLFSKTRKIALLLLVLGMVGGFSRVFCGIHFPFDIIGSMIIAVISAVIIFMLKDQLTFLNRIIISHFLEIKSKIN